MKTAEELKIRIKAGYRLIGLETRDDAAAENAVAEVVREKGGEFKRYSHASNDGLAADVLPEDCARKLIGFLSDRTEDPASVILLWDVGQELDHPEVIAALKKIVRGTDKNASECVVIVAGRAVAFGPELAELATVMTVELPAATEIGDIVREFAAEKGLKIGDADRQECVSALKGLSGFQIRRLLGMVWARTGTMDSHSIRTEKAASLRKGGLLEPVDVANENCNAGGMRNLRGYIQHVSNILSNRDKAQGFGIDTPKGILIVGMPGCGKSLAVKSAAKQFGMPLLRLDTGRLMGKFNGESERNLREALAMAEAQAPCVLWIDEIEKAFAGVGKDSDNGVATRLFGSFLTWMNERQAAVYTIATANDITGLPPELMRRGRFDELFSVDFPTALESEEILKGQIVRRGHVLADDEVSALAQEAFRRGFSGADLEGVVRTGLELAFERGLEAHNSAQGGERASAADFKEAMAIAKSTRESLGPKVEELRNRLDEYRFSPASVGHS